MEQSEKDIIAAMGGQYADISRRGIIAALGGRHIIRGTLKIGSSTLSNWYRMGFPLRRVPDLLRLADQAKQPWITLEILMSHVARKPDDPIR